MTAVHEGIAFDITAANEAEGLQAGQSIIEAQERHNLICQELGKMLSAGEVVRDFRVEGWNRICSPVMGNIIVVTSTTDEDYNLAEQVAHPTNSREPISDISIFEDLNALGAIWRSAHARQIVPRHFHDTGRNR